MLFLALAVLVLLIPLAMIALLPFMLIGRYRAGRARRLARPWVATLNVAVMCFSALFFLGAVAVTNMWVPGTLPSALMGLLVGCGLGLIGLWASRWEAAPGSLHYTPNRWLVLIITFAVAGRVVYGLLRGWNAWVRTSDDSSFVAAFGIPGSLAVAAMVLGYYLAYGIGLRFRISKWQKRSLRVLR
jgi:hypothetical protein